MILTRRELLGTILGLPLLRLAPSVARPVQFERLPHRLTMPKEAWCALATAASCLNGFTTVNDFASEEQAKRLVQTINDRCDDLPWHFAFYFGFFEVGEKRNWLLGNGWEGRLRWVEALARNGAFRIKWHAETVVLEWEDAW